MYINFRYYLVVHFNNRFYLYTHKIATEIYLLVYVFTRRKKGVDTRDRKEKEMCLCFPENKLSLKQTRFCNSLKKNKLSKKKKLKNWKR